MVTVTPMQKQIEGDLTTCLEYGAAQHSALYRNPRCDGEKQGMDGVSHPAYSTDLAVRDQHQPMNEINEL